MIGIAYGFLGMLQVEVRWQMIMSSNNHPRSHTRAAAIASADPNKSNQTKQGMRFRLEIGGVSERYGKSPSGNQSVELRFCHQLDTSLPERIASRRTPAEVSRRKVFGSQFFGQEIRLFYGDYYVQLFFVLLFPCSYFV